MCDFVCGTMSRNEAFVVLDSYTVSVSFECSGCISETLVCMLFVICRYFFLTFSKNIFHENQ